MKNKIKSLLIILLVLTGCDKGSYKYSNTLNYFNSKNYVKIVKFASDAKTNEVLSIYKFIDDKEYNKKLQKRIADGEDKDLTINESHDTCMELLKFEIIMTDESEYKIKSCILSVRLDKLGYKASNEVNSVRYDFIKKNYFIANHLGEELKDSLLSKADMNSLLSKMKKYLKEYLKRTKTYSSKNLIQFLEGYVNENDRNEREAGN